MAKKRRLPAMTACPKRGPHGQYRVRLPQPNAKPKDVFFGSMADPQASKREYQLIVDKWLRRSHLQIEEVTIGVMAARWLTHLQETGKYQKNGRETSTMSVLRVALNVLLETRVSRGDRTTELLSLKASEFTAQMALAYRDEMVRRGFVYTKINQHMRTLQKVLRFGLLNNWLLGDVVLAVEGITTLSSGASVGGVAVREPKKVESAPVRDVLALEEHVRPPVWGMIRLQMLTAMRPQEVRLLQLEDLDMSSDEFWVYWPSEHKTEHLGKRRILFLGASAQGVIREFWPSEPLAYVFDPRKAWESVQEAPKRQRKKKRTGKRPAGDHYTKDSYARAVSRGCAAAGVERWSPNQLRHQGATEVAHTQGLEQARRLLGHTSDRTTLRYVDQGVLTDEERATIPIALEQDRQTGILLLRGVQESG